MVRKLASRIAWHFLGKPYIWGGDDPVRGFDCSGYVIEVLKSVGSLPRTGDWTASDLWARYKSQRVARPHEGCLAFWRASGSANSKIVHVEYCVDEVHAIGASGGGSTTMTTQDAIDQNAYIKVRPIQSRQHIAGYVDPFQQPTG